MNGARVVKRMTLLVESAKILAPLLGSDFIRDPEPPLRFVSERWPSLESRRARDEMIGHVVAIDDRHVNIVVAVVVHVVADSHLAIGAGRERGIPAILADLRAGK